MTQQLTVVLIETAQGWLMINRAKMPYKGLWNGLGGKVEPGETPLEGAVREVREESGLVFTEAALHVSGLVHWYVDGQLRGDLYLYTARTTAAPGATLSREGVLAPQPSEWLLAPDNLGLVPDLVPLLPHLLAGDSLEYASRFDGEKLVSLEVLGAWG